MKEGIKVIGRAKQPKNPDTTLNNSQISKKKECLAKICSSFKPASHTQIQKAFIQYVKTKHPLKAESFVKITNEGKRSLAEGRKQNLEGMKKGAYDLLYAKPRLHTEWLDELNKKGFIDSSHKHGLWIEIKRDKDKVTNEQYEFGILMRENGYDAVICFGLDMAIAVFEDYIAGRDLTKYYVL